MKSGSLVGAWGLVAALLASAPPALAQRVAIASSSGAPGPGTVSTVGVFNLASGQFELLLPGYVSGTPVFTAEGRYLLLRRAPSAGAPSTLELWDTAARTVTPVPLAFEPAVAHPRQTAVFGLAGGVAARLDAGGLHPYNGCGASAAVAVDITGDAGQVVTLCASGAVVVTDSVSGAVIRTVTAGPAGGVTAVVSNADASRVVVTRTASGGGSEFAVVDTATGAVVAASSYPGPPPPAPFTGAVSGGTLLRTTPDRTALVVSRTWSYQPPGGAPTEFAARTGLAAFDTLAFIRALDVPFTPRAVSVSPDGRSALALSGNPGAAGRVQLLDVTTGAEIAAAPLGVPDALGVAHLPLPPAGVTATVVANTLRLDWALLPYSPAATGYRLEAGSQPGASDIGVLDLGAAPGLPTTAIPSGQYYVRVRALNATGVSAPSPDVVVVAPGSPLPTVVAIADGTITEGAAATTTISVVNPAGRSCPVTVTSANGSAVAPADYAAFAGLLVPLTGTTSVSLPLSAVNDTDFEVPETYTLTLALAPGAHPQCQLGDAVATMTIVSDEVPSLVSIADGSVTEGSSATTTIAMTNPAGRTCRVAVTSADGTAVAPGDYVAYTGGIFTLNGVASGVLGLSAVNDLFVEGSETYTLTLALAAGSHPACQLGDNVATITIVSEDVASVISIADKTVTEGIGGTTVVSMTNPAGRTCSVSVTSANGTAVAPGDYTNYQGGTFNLISVASDVLGVSVNNDLLIEGPETYTLTLALLPASDPRCQLGDNVATITILSDDLASVISIADKTVTEGVGGTTIVSMTNPAGRTCSVSVTSANGTAVAPGDYNDYQGATFNLVNVATDVLGVSVNDDLLIEGSENYTLTLALLPGSDPRCQLGDNVATITIVSEDVASVISIADKTVTEGISANATISMTNFAGRTCSVSVTTANGTAVAPGDYSAINGNFNLVNVPSDVLGLSVNDDLISEGPETFTITLALIPGGDPRCRLGDNVATITILSNE